MLFDTHATLAAQASLDSLWLNTKVITSNLANESTPGYKAKRLSFEAALSEASAAQAGRAGQAGAPPSEDPQTNRYAGDDSQQGGAVSGGNFYRSRLTSDSARSERVDGNNVSLEREQAELWKTYAQYSYLLDRVSGHYTSINTAISNMKT